MIIEFDYLNKDVISTHVRIDTETGEVEATDYTDNLMHKFFGMRPHTIEQANISFEMRCFPRTRDRADKVLESLGLQQYNPLDIVRITHGQLNCDYNWIRFEGEDLTWDTVKNTIDRVPESDS